MSEPTKATTDVRATFLTALSCGATPTQAAKATPVCRQHWYQVRNADPDFAAAWAAAAEQGKDAYRVRLLDTYQTRAIDGFTETKTIKDGTGQVQREEVTTRASDRLLLREVERHYREYQPQSNVHVSGEVDVQARIRHELSQPRHMLETLAIRLEYDPAFVHLAPAALPLVRQALAELEAGEAVAVEGEVRPA